MWWAFFKCVEVTLVGLFLSLAFSSNTQAWSGDIAPEYRMSEIKTHNPNPCPGNFEDITVSGEGSFNACVMGKYTRVASYFPAQGGTVYAVSFPFNNTFYRLDVCLGTWGCVYSETSDTFVGMSFGYKHFLNNLTKTIQYGVVHYVPSENSITFSMNEIEAPFLIGNSVAISNNGRWAVVEMKKYGIFRFDTETHQMRRIIAPGYTYEFGYIPMAEMAISNDGSTVIVTGMRAGLSVVMVDETCGDSLNESMQINYAGTTTPCRLVPTNPGNSYMPGMVYALAPRFSNHDKNISFDVFSNSAASHITLLSETQDTQPDSFYVAMGDSFTSGQGETDDLFYIGGAENPCHLSRRSYPFVLAGLWGYPVASTACSGATIDAARGKVKNQTAQLSALESYLPQVTTIGIGGNDAGLIGKLKDCLGLDTCKWAKTPKDRQVTALEIKNIYPHLKDFYKDVKDRTAGAVVVVGYPLIISTEPVCASPIGLLLNETERQFMSEGLHYLNEVIRAAAFDSGVAYVNVENAFAGNELCTTLTSPYMNDIRIGDDIPDIANLSFLKVIGNETFHPKPAGHAVIASRIFQTYPNPLSLGGCSCTTPTPVPLAGTYWNSQEVSSVLQHASSFLNKTAVKIGDSIEISLPAFSFQPFSDVMLELHSEVKDLGAFHALGDGGLQVTTVVKDVDQGFHSAHLVGQDFSGNAIDIYDFLEITDNDTFLSMPSI